MSRRPSPASGISRTGIPWMPLSPPVKPYHLNAMAKMRPPTEEHHPRRAEKQVEGARHEGRDEDLRQQVLEEPPRERREEEEERHGDDPEPGAGGGVDRRDLPGLRTRVFFPRPRVL